jgi:hypothetical protein
MLSNEAERLAGNVTDAAYYGGGIVQIGSSWVLFNLCGGAELYWLLFREHFTIIEP